MEPRGSASEDCAAYFRRVMPQYVASLRIELAAGFFCAMHAHPVWEIVYHPRGRGETLAGTAGPFAFAEGSLFLYPPNQPHAQRMEVTGEDWCLLVEAPETLPVRPAPCWYLPAVTDPLVVQEIAQTVAQTPSPDPLERQVQSFRVSAILAHIIRSVAVPNPRHPAQEGFEEQAYRFIEQHYHRRLRVAEVAQEAGVSESYLRQGFQRKYGMSPGQWLTRVRVARAQDLLRYSSLPLKEIAIRCGFDNERYFSTVFRAATGSTPGAFRRISGIFS